MNCFPGRKMVTIAVLVMFLARMGTPVFAAKSAVKLNKWAGAINFSEEGPSAFTLHGTASHLGLFTAEGEVTLARRGGGAVCGRGVVVFTAANGDLLWERRSGKLRHRRFDAFVWADSFVSAMERRYQHRRFVDDRRQPGRDRDHDLIGMLLPAVQ
jgi:hypothetical protein